MALAKKGRRTITVDEREYYWWVMQHFDDDFVGSPTLTVASKEPGLYVRYGLAQDEGRYAVVLGPVFRGIEGLDGWRRFFCPRFGNERTISPRGVAEFIRWCTASDGPVVEFDWRGKRTTHNSGTIRWPRSKGRPAKELPRPPSARRRNPRRTRMKSLT